MYTIADVQYDDTTHTSRLPDGQPVPHVTAILEAVGVSTDFEELSDRNPRIAALVAQAGARGTAVHADCHAWDDDDLDLNCCHSVVRPYVEAWIACRWNECLISVAHARERRVYHPVYSYTGILDGIFLRSVLDQPKKRILIDLKTGNPDSAAAHLQTSAYEQAWTHMHPDQPIDERWAVWLRPGRRVPYTVINYTAKEDGWQDFAKFQACLTVYNEQPARRERRG